MSSADSRISRGLRESQSKLTTAPILRYPKYDIPFILETDVSLKGLGAVLSHKHEGLIYVIAYASRKLKSAEYKIQTIDR